MSSYALEVTSRHLHIGPLRPEQIFGVLIGFYLTGLPRLYLPLFDAPGFERATLDRFLIGNDAADPSFSAIQAERDLRELGATRVTVARRRPEP